MATADVIVASPKPMKLSPQTFTIAFGYAEPVNAFLYKNDSIFTIKVALQTVYRNIFPNGTLSLDSTNTPLQTETCTEAHFGPYANNFSNIQIDQLICIQQKQLDSLTIQGAPDSQIFQFLEVLVIPCDSAISTCGTKEELDYYLGGKGHFTAYFTDIAIDTRDYKAPTRGLQNHIFSLFGNKGYKEVFFTLNHVEMLTDSGWFTKDLNTENYVKYDSITETTTTADSNILLKFQMRVSPTTKFISRSYIKIQDIFAQANGLAAVALMVLLFLMTPYSNLKFNESIINELFEINAASLEFSNSIQGINRKKSGQSDRSDRSGDRRTPPQNHHQIALSILPTEKEKLNEFETLSSPRPLLQGGTSASEQYQFSEEKQTLEPQTEPDKFTSPSRDNLSALLFPEPIESQESPFKPVSPTAHTPKKLSVFASMNKKPKKQSYITGPNSLIWNKPNDKKPSSKVLEQQDELDFKSVELMLQSFTEYENNNSPPPVTQPNTSMMAYSYGLRHGNKEELEVISEVNSSLQPGNSMEEVRYVRGMTPDNEFFSSESDRKHDPRALDKQIKNIATRMNKDGEGLNITFWDYLLSFVRKSDRYKKKIKLLETGIEMINKRLDIFELFNNFREVEKLKLLLLDYEQAVLFENLPKPMIEAEEEEPPFDVKSFPRRLLTTGRAVPDDKKGTEVCEAFKTLALRRSSGKSMIDAKLLKVYEERFNN